MTTKTIKILGVQFAANPDYKFGDPETEEMWMRTITLLTELRDRKPRVVLKAARRESRDGQGYGPEDWLREQRPARRGETAAEAVEAWYAGR